MNLKDKRRNMELRLLDKFPQYGDIIYSIIEELEEQDKQAIKDLKEELKNNKINKRRTNNQIINKIMGIWEE